MANNRIYLKCKGCGKMMFLGKTFGDGYYWIQYDGHESLTKELNNFYNEHAFCAEIPDNGFEIEYEIDRAKMEENENE